MPRAAVVALAAVGALVLVVLGAVGVTLLKGDEEAAPAPPVAEPAEERRPDPADTVDDLVDAAEDDACAEAEALATDELLANDHCASAEWAALSADDVEVTIGGAVDAGPAIVQAAVVSEGEDAAGDEVTRTMHLTFLLQLAGEEWRVDDYWHADVGSADPRIVLETFFRAVFDGDCELATTYATAEYLERQGECMTTQYGDEELADVEWEFGEVRRDGRRRAVVPATLTNGEDVSTGDWELVVREREWRVHRLPD